MSDNDVFKKSVEDDLKKIQECKIDILVFKRSNDNLCSENNKEIEKLTEEIENRELSLEENLSKSGEKKIDTSAGWCSFRVMPDKWEYDEPVIIAYCKDNSLPYYKTVESVKKAELKKDMQSYKYKETVPGVIVTPQDPKFNYKLNGGI